MLFSRPDRASGWITGTVLLTIGLGLAGAGLTLAQPGASRRSSGDIQREIERLEKERAARAAGTSPGTPAGLGGLGGASSVPLGGRAGRLSEGAMGPGAATTPPASPGVTLPRERRTPSPSVVASRDDDALELAAQARAVRQIASWNHVSPRSPFWPLLGQKYWHDGKEFLVVGLVEAPSGLRRMILLPPLALRADHFIKSLRPVTLDGEKLDRTLRSYRVELTAEEIGSLSHPALATRLAFDPIHKSLTTPDRAAAAEQEWIARQTPPPSQQGVAPPSSLGPMVDPLADGTRGTTSGASASNGGTPPPSSSFANSGGGSTWSFGTGTNVADQPFGGNPARDPILSDGAFNNPSTWNLPPETWGYGTLPPPAPPYDPHRSDAQAVGGFVGGAVGDAVGSEIGNQIGGAIGEAAVPEEWKPLGRLIGGFVGQIIGGAVGEAVGNEAGHSAGGYFYDAATSP